jgi:membrane protein DedA with SNARE-associated domain
MEHLQELNNFIVQYGYFAIFIFIFLQELGVPNPVTNELVLIFSGYLAYTGTLSLTKVIFIAVFADFTGTAILYFIFYGLSKYYFFKDTPKWLKKFVAKIEKLKYKVEKGNRWTIFIGRLTPFLRGYMSVAAGTIQLKPKTFLTTVLLSAITWSGGLVLTGKLLGPYWSTEVNSTGIIQIASVILLFIISMLIAGKYVSRSLLIAKVDKGT